MTVARFFGIGLLPVLAMVPVYLILDPFKVVHSYDVFYPANEKGTVGLNKSFIGTANFIKFKDQHNYDSFIFGNSRSMFYQVSDWKKYLPDNSTCYHFDGSGESLYALHKKVRFVDSLGMPIKNVLLVLDRSLLAQVEGRTGPLFMTPPPLVNNSNFIDFHISYFKSFISPRFMIAYLDFTLTHVIKPYMIKGGYLYDNLAVHDIVTNEIRFEFTEKQIAENKFYTPERIREFYHRDGKPSYSERVIETTQRRMLTDIAKTFKKHNTQYKVIISPLYDQQMLNAADLRYLKSIYGAKNVYDYSGINKFTSDYRNYYETSHYRPHIGREILGDVYEN
jgi:hypothetical protein